MQLRPIKDAWDNERYSAHYPLKKKMIALVLVIVVLVSMFPMVSLATDTYVVKVSSFDELKAAVTNADKDIIVDITDNISTSSAWTISTAHEITITSSSNKELSFNGSMGIMLSGSTHLIFRDLQVNVTGKLMGISVMSANATLDIINSTVKATNAQALIVPRVAGATVNLYSGEITNPLEGEITDTTKAVSNTGGTFNILPTGNINVNGSIITEANAVSKIIPQSGYVISAVSVDNVDIVVDSEYTMKNVDKNLSITVNGSEEPSFSGGSGQATVEDKTIDYAWSYGGTVTEESGAFTITPYTADGINYVIDAVYVDGKKAEVENPTEAFTVSNAESSVFASFAYTLNFQNPADGTLSVSRGGVSLKSGDIVRGGDVLTITYTDSSNTYRLDEKILRETGITGISYVEGTGYVVTAINGEATPAIDLSTEGVLVPVQTAATPVFTPVDGSKVEVGTTVTITSETEGAVIYYTTDGTTPAKTSAEQYTEPVVITGDLTIKAVAVKDGMNASTVAQASYTVNRYSLTGVSEHGTLSFSVGDDTLEAAIPRSTVAVTVSPEENYALSSLTYDYEGLDSPADITSAKSFTMPSKPVTVTATYVDKPTVASISKVATESQLRRLALEVNSGVDYAGLTVTLENNIELTGEWIPIGNDPYGESSFKGIFDGNGHTISGLSITSSDEYLGLFGGITDGGSVIDLTVEGTIQGTKVTTAGGSQYIGGIVAYTTRTQNSEAGNVILKNCISRVNIRAQRAYAGGIAGSVYSTDIEGCANEGNVSIRADDSLSDSDASDIKVFASAGGIAGSFSGGSFTGCINEGSISTDVPLTKKTDVYSGASWWVTDNNVVSVGGLIGTGSGTISSSTNHGAISGNMVCAGGLVGEGNYHLIINDCYNTGDITSTIEREWNRARVGGLVGSVRHCQYNLTITDSYNTGAVTAPDYIADIENGLYRTLRIDEIEANSVDAGSVSGYNGVTKRTNVYKSTDISALENGVLTAAMLNGESGTAWKDSAVYNRPILYWETDITDGEPQEVTFTVTPEGVVSAVTVSARADFSNPLQANENGVYSLSPGTYYYKVEAEGYVTESGSFSVSGSSRTVEVGLRKAAIVTFNVNPADADFVLTDINGATVNASQSEGGVYTYVLYEGTTYAYDASASGHNSTSRQFVASGNDTVTVTLTESSRPDAGSDKYVYGSGNADKISSITAGGTYYLGDGATGVLTISTSQDVTLVGSGIGNSSAYKNLYIDNTVSGAKLTLRDVYISNNAGSSDAKMTNMIDFTGSGNVLNFDGVCILDQDTNATGYAMIHVNKDTELTITGGTAYLYKNEQGAGIGGNGGNGAPLTPEVNGRITIDGATLFLKGSKQGATIGSGAGTGSGATPGNISIYSSTLSFIANSRGASIGGSAGSEATPGGSVNISDSNVTFNLDYSGAAIGGGGYNGGNDADGGNLRVSGSSIRAYIDTNGAGLWSGYGVTSAGVNRNAAVTANVTDSSGNELYLLEFDTSKLTNSSSRFNVTADGESVYSGSLHKWRYVNEDTSKYGQAGISYTIDNWTSLDDSNLYLYIKGKTQTLSVNGENFTATWDSEKKNFTLTDASGTVTNGSSSSTEVPKVTETVTTDTKVENGTASTTVTTENITSAVENVGSSTNAEIVINAASGEADVTKSEVTIPKESLSAVESGTSANLVVKTDVGNIEISNADLSALTSASGENVSIVLEKNIDGSVSVAVTVGGKSVSSDKSIVKVSPKVDDSLLTALAGSADSGANPNLVAVLVNEDGSNTLVKYSLVDADGYATLLMGTEGTVSVINNGKVYADVASDAWYYNAVSFASSHELFQGVSDNEFAPGASMTRGMFVTVLSRLAGEEDYAGSSEFTDVAADQWYASGVAWASANGIVTGYGDGTFGPNDSVTREQMAVIMYNYVQKTGIKLSGSAALDGFDDADAVDSWAEDAMKWAVGVDLMKGNADGTLNPLGLATRAEVATIMQNFITAVLK